MFGTSAVLVACIMPPHLRSSLIQYTYMIFTSVLGPDRGRVEYCILRC